MVHLVVFHQHASNLSVPVDHVEHALGKSGSIIEFGGYLAHYGGQLTRLENNGVALQKGRSRTPETPDGERKVPWGHHGNHALGLSYDIGVPFGNLRTDNLAARLPALAKTVLSHVESLHNLGVALIQGFARLARDVPCHITLSLLDDPAKIKDVLGATDSAQGPPGISALVGEFDRGVNLFAR